MAFALRAPQSRMEAHRVVDGGPVDGDAAMLFEIDLTQRSGDRLRLGPELKSPLTLSLKRRFGGFLCLLFFDGRKRPPRVADFRPRLPVAEEIGDQLHRAWEIDAFDLLDELDDVAAAAGADPEAFFFVPAPGRIVVPVSGDRAMDMGGSFLRGPGYPEPAQEFDFPSPQGRLRLIDGKTGVAQGNRGLIGVVDNAGELSLHRITDHLSMTPGLPLKARGFSFSYRRRLSGPRRSTKQSSEARRGAFSRLRAERNAAVLDDFLHGRA